MIRYSQLRSQNMFFGFLWDRDPPLDILGPLQPWLEHDRVGHTEEAQDCLMFGGSSTSFLAETSTMALASCQDETKSSKFLKCLKSFRFRSDICISIFTHGFICLQTPDMPCRLHQGHVLRPIATPGRHHQHVPFAKRFGLDPALG